MPSNTATDVAIDYIQELLHKAGWSMGSDSAIHVPVDKMYDILLILEQYQSGDDEMTSTILELESELAASCSSSEREEMKEDLENLQDRYNKLLERYAKILGFVD